MTKKTSRKNGLSERKQNQLLADEDFQRLRTHWRGLSQIERGNGVKALLDKFPNERMQTRLAALLKVDEKMIRRYRDIGSLVIEDKNQIENGESIDVIIQDAKRRTKNHAKDLKASQSSKSSKCAPVRGGSISTSTNGKQQVSERSIVEAVDSEDPGILIEAGIEKSQGQPEPSVEPSSKEVGQSKETPIGSPESPADSKPPETEEDRREKERKRVRFPELKRPN